MPTIWRLSLFQNPHTPGKPVFILSVVFIPKQKSSDTAIATLLLLQVEKLLKLPKLYLVPSDYIKGESERRKIVFFFDLLE